MYGVCAGVRGVVCLCVSVYVVGERVGVCVSACVFGCVCVCMWFNTYVCVGLYFLGPSLCLPLCLSARLCVCLFVHLSMCVCVCHIQTHTDVPVVSTHTYHPISICLTV
eukprot:GHVQ01041160.1.p1 GENE.GHVQ01041160.1~~GHVQ01041160.1.p1  ORF type:complete len:109 (-),score=14.78 GHVQ01041160.1:63-389(-)